MENKIYDFFFNFFPVLKNLLNTVKQSTQMHQTQMHQSMQN